MRLTFPSGHVVQLDDSDAHVLAGRRWQVEKRLHTMYVVAFVGPRARRSKLYLHREILGAQPGQLVDHINHDGLDCRRANLRMASRSGNAANTPKRRAGWSQYKGVKFDQRRGTWSARITVNYREIYLGRFDSEIGAADAYDRAALQYFGEMARINVARDAGLEARG